jgi:uncharacterized protein YxeA
MKKNIILCMISMIIGVIAGFVVCHNTMDTEYNSLLNAYDSYNKATEDLLDTLDNHYDWVDAFDPQEYYESRAKLDSLLWK